MSDFLELDRCPHCGVSKPALERISSQGHKGNSRDVKWVIGIYWCRTCGDPIFDARHASGGGRYVYPSAESVESELPERAKEYLSQAMQSPPAGGVILAASAVDSMLKAKGYSAKGESLYTRIDKAVNAGLLTEDMGKWAHQIRLDANDQRHADEGAPLPSAEDAKRVIHFAKVLGHFLFVVPAMVERGLKTSAPRT